MGRGAPEAPGKFREVYALAKEKGDQVTAAEAKVALGRIAQSDEDFDHADEEFADAEAQLPKEITEAPTMPRHAHNVGHSLVVAPDCNIPEEIILIFVRHFQAKNRVLRGIRRQRPADIGEGIKGLEQISLVDEKADPVNFAFDQLWQVQARMETGDYDGAGRCLARSREVFSSDQGAGAGYLHLHRGLLIGSDGKRWEDEFDEAMTYFIKIGLWQGVVAVNRHCQEFLSRRDASKEDLERAFNSALIAATLRPTRYSLQDLAKVRGYLRSHYERQSDWDDYVEERVRELERFEGPVFSPLEKLVQGLGSNTNLDLFRKGIARTQEQLQAANFNRFQGLRSRVMR